MYKVMFKNSVAARTFFVNTLLQLTDIMIIDKFEVCLPWLARSNRLPEQSDKIEAIDLPDVSSIRSASCCINNGFYSKAALLPPALGH